MTGLGEQLGSCHDPPLRGGKEAASPVGMTKLGSDADEEASGMPALHDDEGRIGRFSALCLDRLDEAGQNGDRDGNVADGDEDGDNLGEALQPGRVDGMAEAERLEHAPQAVIEVIAKHDHGDDVEERRRARPGSR